MRIYRIPAALVLAAMLTGCAADTSTMDSLIEVQQTATEAVTEPQTQPETTIVPRPSETLIDASNGEYDIDLTILQSSMVYAQVYDMVYESENYEGKLVRAKGNFAHYQDPRTQKDYYAVLISDATACCSQGIEFVLEGDPVFPDDYPEEGTEITISGVFNAYKEDSSTYVQLLDAKIEA